MQSLWSDRDAKTIGDDPVALRVYTSRLLGREPSLVLHGGGNTSVKATSTNLFGDAEDVLYVKGSGWDLATIEAAGFAPVRMRVLLQLAELSEVPDPTLVRVQRSAMTDPSAPDPSVEAVLHAIIPYRYVDHTHADAVIAITNTPGAERVVRALFGARMLIVPYFMPGFKLARAVHELTTGIEWKDYDGMILMHHGVFTWGDSARASYEAMIDVVSRAERYLEQQGALRVATASGAPCDDLQMLSRLRKAVSAEAGRAMIARLNEGAGVRGFADLPNVGAVAVRGCLTPDHVIRTKRRPLIVVGDTAADVRAYAQEYREYFARNETGSLTMLDQAPRWAVWPGHGIVAFGATRGDAAIVSDIADHTIAAVQWAESLGGWSPLPEKELFEVEYWDLEQAKLKRRGAGKPLDGRVALVTGAASGIGKAVAEELARQGAAVVGVDIAFTAGDRSPVAGIDCVPCDVTDTAAVTSAIAYAVRSFGGLDILVSNAGIFPDSARIESLDPAKWERTLAVNLTSHQRMLQACIPYLRNGIEPAVVVVGSKNVPAPGPGQAAYSVSKAGVTQLARIAALELANDGIRVNIVHPNAVFDTAIWTPEVLAQRAAAYGLSVDDYKRSNLLHAEVTSRDVAEVVVALAGPSFRRTTGAQIPIDGGNERVI